MRRRRRRGRQYSEARACHPVALRNIEWGGVNRLKFGKFFTTYIHYSPPIYSLRYSGALNGPHGLLPMTLRHGLTPLWAAVAGAPTSCAAALLALDGAGPADLAALPKGDSLPTRARKNLDAAFRVLEIGAYAERVEERPETQVVVPQSAEKRQRTPPKEVLDERATLGVDVTKALRTHVAELQRWARESAHVDAPETALRAVCSHGCPETGAKLLLPNGTDPCVAAALVRAVVVSGGGVFAYAVAAGPLTELLRNQRAAAPRDLIAALETLADTHPRAALALFDAASDRAAAPTAEALSRVAGRLQACVAKDALVNMSDAKWGEHGVRVVEALVAKARGTEDIAECVVRGLEQNVGGLEKSLRFGKLLLAAVRDVRGVKEQYAAVIRNIAVQSSVFLAKRAVAMLPKE